LQRIIAAEAAMMALQEENPLTRAKQSLASGDLKGAREHLAIARQRMPDYTASSPVTVDILVELGDHAETETFVLEGLKRFPRLPHFLEGYALVAERRHELEEAARRWAAVRKRFPTRKGPFIHEADCLRELGRLKEADTVIGRAVRAFPNDVSVLNIYGRIGEALGDWEEAYRRWDTFRDRHVIGLVGTARALHRLGRTEEAGKLLAEGRFRYPLERDVPAMQARIAEETGAREGALKLWATIRERFPLDRVGYVEGLRYLRELQEWTAADAVAQSAIERFPSQPWPLAEYASLAHHRRDWAEAARRWAAVCAAFPYHQGAQKNEIEALTAARQTDVIGGGSTECHA
jgi:tetratricopeptide (TPR) repeat protein